VASGRGDNPLVRHVAKVVLVAVLAGALITLLTVVWIGCTAGAS
jgi:hypothetical protein